MLTGHDRHLKILEGLSTDRCLLSVNEEATVVDLWDEDDDSGRQQWSVDEVSGQEGVFTLSIRRGVEAGTVFLGVSKDGQQPDLWEEDDGSGLQWWLFEKITDAGESDYFTIRTASEVSGDRVYLGAAEDGSTVDLREEDDGSGLQRWKVVPAFTPRLFSIGGGEEVPLTHVGFEAPPGMIRASVRVVVDQIAPSGLNFFALQVDFNNSTWAHGGLQTGEEQDGVPVRQVNWGGLADRGGGNEDYEQQDAVEDLLKIQNPPRGEHIGQYAWKEGVEYEYVVERGELVTLPPGKYRYFPDAKPVQVESARDMWEWRFTVTPLTEEGEPFVATMYNSADAFDAFCVWNESGYGSTDAEQHTGWSLPTYRLQDESSDQTPDGWSRDLTRPLPPSPHAAERGLGGEARRLSERRP